MDIPHGAYTEPEREKTKMKVDPRYRRYLLEMSRLDEILKLDTEAIRQLVELRNDLLTLRSNPAHVLPPAMVEHARALGAWSYERINDLRRARLETQIEFNELSLSDWRDMPDDGFVKE